MDNPEDNQPQMDQPLPEPEVVVSYSDQPVAPKKNRTWLIIIIVIVVVLLCICLVIIAAIGLLGPVVGGVFENVIEGIETLP